MGPRHFVPWDSVVFQFLFLDVYLEDMPPLREWFVKGSYILPPFITTDQAYLENLRSPWLLTTYPSHGMILQVVRAERWKANSVKVSAVRKIAAGEAQVVML